MSSFPLPTLAAKISPTGISAPQLSDIIASEQATYEGIYGSDVVLTPDTQDGQLISIRSAAINDANQLAIAVYNSFFPGSAQGVGLSAIVAINGLLREAATNSTVELVLIGQAGVFIPAGIVLDTSGNLWNLPANITIPPSGTITVTATAQKPGVSAAANTVTTIYTIIAGWQSVTNPTGATQGVPVESDAALRQRQAKSTALPAQTPLSSILAAAANSGGIGRFAIYENQGSNPDSNGVPGHSVAVVVEGGNIQAVAQAIESKKSPGTGTYGTTTVQVQDPAGVPIDINFFELTEVPIFAAITIQPLNGYVASTGTAIVQALVNFISALAIGEEIFINWLLGAAGLSGSPLSQTFVITSLTIGLSPTSLGAANIPIAFNAGATCVTGNVTLTVL